VFVTQGSSPVAGLSDILHQIATRIEQYDAVILDRVPRTNQRPAVSLSVALDRLSSWKYVTLRGYSGATSITAGGNMQGNKRILRNGASGCPVSV
jgi:hypothetical protein